MGKKMSSAHMPKGSGKMSSSHGSKSNNMNQTTGGYKVGCNDKTFSNTQKSTPPKKIS